MRYTNCLKNKENNKQKKSKYKKTIEIGGVMIRFICMFGWRGINRNIA